MIGTRIGPYRIVAPLGAGGMGEVYRARDERLGRDVAIKVLPSAVAEDPERMARFEREARALAALSHPNILAIHDFSTDAGVTYAVTELLEGETLRQRLERERLPWRRSVEIAAAVADGLAAAHNKGIIHRDIKPDNIFITTDGRVKVLDFGLARLERASHAGERGTTVTDPGTVAGTVLGTVGYMAPEQVRGLAADARSDIFTLGCLLYEMLAGKRAFARETANETMAAILKDPAPEVSVSGVEVTPELNRIVAHCLEKNPGERFQSASDLSFSLKSLLTGRVSVQPGPGRNEASSLSPTPSIAVLPFVNLSSDPEQEYFCDGMAEEIINALTRIKNLQVVARTSAFSFKGKNTDIREIGKQLNVGKLLEGSVRRSGNRLRITAQLINVEDGYHLWSERYDRNLEDIFEIQDEISLAIADTLEIKLLKKEKETLIKQPTADMEAYQLYLRGRFCLGQMTAQSLAEAIDCFKGALRRDPAFALAYAGIVECYAWLCVGLGILLPQESVRHARESALKAVELDPELAEAHTASGMVATFFDWDRESAGKSFDRALALNANSADALRWCAFYLLLLEHKQQEVLELLCRAQALDPLHDINHFITGLAKNVSGRFDEVIEENKQLLSLDPHRWNYFHSLGEAYSGKGTYAEAIACFQEAIRLGGRLVANVAELGYVQARTNNTAEAEALLKEVWETTHQSDMYYGYAAFVYVGLGQYDKALDCLERSCEVHDAVLLFFPLIPLPGFDELRREPRYKALLTKAGLSHLLH